MVRGFYGEVAKVEVMLASAGSSFQLRQRLRRVLKENNVSSESSISVSFSPINSYPVHRIASERNYVPKTAMLRPRAVLVVSMSLLVSAQPLRSPVVEGVGLKCPSPTENVLQPRGVVSSPLSLNFYVSVGMSVGSIANNFYNSEELSDSSSNASSREVQSLSDTTNTQTTEDCPPDDSCTEPNTSSGLDAKQLSSAVEDPSASTESPDHFISEPTTTYTPMSTTTAHCNGCSEAAVATQSANAAVS